MPARRNVFLMFMAIIVSVMIYFTATNDKPAALPGTITITVVSDESVMSSETKSWETWVWNSSMWVGNWPSLSSRRYCGIANNDNTITCQLPGNSGDVLLVNGTWGAGNRWLIESDQGSTVSYITRVSIDDIVYPVDMSIETDSPAPGTCNRKPNNYDLLCTLM